MYMSIEDILNNKIALIPSHDILTILLFFILLFIINFVILLLSKKRWLKLGM